MPKQSKDKKRHFKGKQIFCKARLIALTADSENTVPEWIQVLPMGNTRANDTDLLVDDQALKDMLVDFQGRKNDLVLDYEHQTLDGVEAPAAGWIVELEARPDGLWAKVDWTDRGHGYVSAREYRYISPVVFVDEKTSRCYRLQSAALTNNPAIDGMQPVAAKEEKGGNDNMDLLTKLIELLGLAPEATEDEAVGAVQLLLTSGGEGTVTEETITEAIDQAVEEAVGETMDNIEEVLIEVEDAVSSGDTVAVAKAKTKFSRVVAKAKNKDAYKTRPPQKVSPEAKELRRMKAEMVVEKAITEGKVTPAMRNSAMMLALKDSTAFEAMMKTAPKAVPLKDEFAGGGIARGSRPGQMELEVGRRVGLTEEDIAKYGGKK